MVDRRQAESVEEKEIDLGKYISILRSHGWKILLLSLSVGIISLVVSFLFSNIYRATATIAPSTDEEKSNPALGALTNFGITVGGPSKVEDLEALFKSKDLTVRVFEKGNLWQYVHPEDIDRKTGKIKVGWLSRLRGEEEDKIPDDWDAIRAAEDRLRVLSNKKMGTLTISFESPSPEGSATIVRYYLEEGKSRLQEEAFGRANKNKKFIEEQIGKTVDTLTRDRLYSLFGQEVEREMLARNREQFGFSIIDSPRVPDRKAKPQRAIISLLATVLSSMLWAVIFVLRAKRKERDYAGRPNLS